MGQMAGDTVGLQVGDIVVGVINAPFFKESCQNFSLRTLGLGNPGQTKDCQNQCGEHECAIARRALNHGEASSE